jgi:hypothetical protein
MTLKGTLMAWLELTEIGGRKLYLNMNEIVVIEEYQWTGGVGATLTSTIHDKDARPIKYQVRESAEEIYHRSLLNTP